MNVLLVDATMAGEEAQRLLIEHPSGSAVLAFDPVRRVAFTVRQSRLAVMYKGHPTLAEPVAGVTESEDWSETARRECEEEIGVRLRNLEAVGQVWITPSSSTEHVHLFLGEYGPQDRIGSGGGAPGEAEKLDIREEQLDHLWRAATSDALADAKLFMLLHALRVRRPELFSAS